MNRCSWWSAPDALRAEVEDRLGSAIVEASTQPGGFSPGVAALCVLDDGRNVFIKACGTSINPMTTAMHRREVGVLETLGGSSLVPRLIDVVDDFGWVALLIVGVRGRLPTARDHGAVERALALIPRIHSLPTTGFCGPEDAPFASLQTSPWADMRADDVEFDPWCSNHLELLLELEQEAAVLDAPVVCHGDFRLDNVLFAADGRTLLGDWAQAATGPPFADLMEVSIDINVEGGPRPAQTFATHVRKIEIGSSDAVTAHLAAVAGRLTRLSTFPEPPGITNLRAFQRLQAIAARDWLAERIL